MLRKSSTYIIILWLLFQFFVDEINCQTTSFRPGLRGFHTATLIDYKLYILGGNIDAVIGKEFFYLDFSAKFNTKELPWKDLSDINPLPVHFGSSSARGGANNNTLFLYGGNSSDTVLVHTFDPQSNTWSIPKITGENTIRKQNLMGIINRDGKMYLWGGSMLGGDVSDMLILDTINLIWGKGSITNVPTPRVNYGAVILPDQTIIYLGGFNSANGLEIPLDVINIYDTINDKWSPKTTYGEIPSARDGFSSILGFDNKRIIIFGGASDIENNYIPPGDALYVLDLTNYTWYIPKTSGKTPSSRIGHQANLVGNYMVISFGVGYVQKTESDILLLDISNNENYNWTVVFDPSLISATTISPPSSKASNVQPSESKSDSKSSTATLIGVMVGFLIGGALLSAGGFFLYNWIKNRRIHKNVLLTPGSETERIYIPKKEIL